MHRFIACERPTEHLCHYVAMLEVGAFVMDEPPVLARYWDDVIAVTGNEPRACYVLDRDISPYITSLGLPRPVGGTQSARRRLVCAAVDNTDAINLPGERSIRAHIAIPD